MGIATAQAHDGLAVTGIGGADWIRQALGHADGGREGVGGCRRFTEEVVRRAARGEQVCLAREVTECAGGLQCLVEHLDGLTRAVALGQAPGEARRCCDCRAMIVERTESCECCPQGRVGFIVHALRGKCRTEDLACAGGECGVIV